jgi:hypothetical protein
MFILFIIFSFITINFVLFEFLFELLVELLVELLLNNFLVLLPIFEFVLFEFVICLL